ncbi:DUF4230 domain-containing protein [Oscillatoria sp. FACHB-1407]|uniref:DUF4230 domain-containing protein n=1 Tax=Oscillatoria sp. FACHB-1407 TaxID=2692847 RepID=UPI001686DC95|nr:DUF4230 domain-containing protein [Oscillatoria sp. FACHB-1407]
MTRMVEAAIAQLVWGILLIVTLTLFIAFGVPQLQAHWASQPAATSEVRSLIINGLKDMTELTTVNVSTKATIVTQQNRKLFGMRVGNTNLVYEGVGTVRAGIDLKELQVKEVSMGDRHIHVVLPPPYVTDVSLDVNRSSILAHYRRWFGPNAELDLQERAQADALEKIRAEACESHALEVANQNAKHLIEEILQKGGFQEVLVETQLPTAKTC